MQSAAPYPEKVIRNSVNMPDPIRNRFGYGQLWPLRPACSQNRALIVYARSDFSHPFQIIIYLFFQRRQGSYCAEPTRIRSGWSGQGLAKQIWSGSKPVCRNHLTVSHFQTRFRSFATDVSDNAVPNQPGSDSVLADCVRFWPNGSGPEASRCARIIRPASGQCFPADPDRKRIGSGMFTGEFPARDNEVLKKKKKKKRRRRRRRKRRKFSA